MGAVDGYIAETYVSEAWGDLHIGRAGRLRAHWTNNSIGVGVGVGVGVGLGIGVLSFNYGAYGLVRGVSTVTSEDVLQTYSLRMGRLLLISGSGCIIYRTGHEFYTPFRG